MRLKAAEKEAEKAAAEEAAEEARQARRAPRSSACETASAEAVLTLLRRMAASFADALPCLREARVQL